MAGTMFKMTMDHGVLGRYLTVDIQVENTVITLNDGQSMGVSEIDQLVADMEVALKDLKAQREYIKGSVEIEALRRERLKGTKP